MKLKAVLFSLFASFFLSFAAQASASQTTPSATFLTVTGKVSVGKKGDMRAAVKDRKAFEGETVKVSKDGKATLQLFDGSTLDLTSGSQLTLATLKQPSADEKLLHFDLLVGHVLATVRKLLSKSSSFEVEAGGVVCGVRGTKFQVGYDPDSKKVELQVFEGSVFTSGNGENNLFKAGDQMQFMNGLLQKMPNQSFNPGNNLNSAAFANGQASAGAQSPMEGIDQSAYNYNTQDWSDSWAALGDLSGWFDDSIGYNGDNVFTDPFVEGSVKVTIHMNVPANEKHP